MRYFRALLIAALAAVLLSTPALAQWPTTCVALNDIVENHLGNHNNVGIYQRVFGDQAEQACQNDHRDDVRGVFAWAFPEGGGLVVPLPATSPTAPSITPAELDARIAGFIRAGTAHLNAANASIAMARQEINAATAATQARDLSAAASAIRRSSAHWADVDNNLRASAIETTKAAAEAEANNFPETSRLLYATSTTVFTAAGNARQISDNSLVIADHFPDANSEVIGPLLAENQRLGMSLADLLASGAEESSAVAAAMAAGR